MTTWSRTRSRLARQPPAIADSRQTRSTMTCAKPPDFSSRAVTRRMSASMVSRYGFTAYL
ncbi:hypothetical protein [Escherichia coli]|uniref:hypothetical protein n=1 Tax=Escherichia coli TaxID=562 RepID=UPI00190C6FB5|nr:hypothetical protein [Escherichia coli]MBK2451778.1 hypothetical protein [Escherichia coli]